MRQLVLRRDNWTCRKCGHWGNECDHVIPLAAGGEPYDLDNIQVLCRRCHWDKTGAENGLPDPERTAWRTELRRMMAGAVSI